MRLFRLPPILLALVCGSFVFAADASAQQAPKRPTLPSGFTAEYDVKYISEGDAAQTLDIYFPEKAADQPQPLLIWIHGGGWSAGSKAGVPYLNQLSRGYVVASIEYRFSQKALFPAQIQDCQAAIRWLRAHAKKYNIDPEHIGVGGASAGGHLAAQAVCDIFGPADFWTVIKQADEDKNIKNIFKWNNGDPYSKLIGAKLGEDREKCDAVSPVHYVSKDNPPFLILHGDRDALVPYAQSVELADLLGKAGVPVTLQRLPGAGHGGPSFGLPAVGKLANAFFDKHLKGVDAKIEPLPEDAVTIPPKKE